MNHFWPGPDPGLVAPISPFPPTCTWQIWCLFTRGKKWRAAGWQWKKSWKSIQELQRHAPNESFFYKLLEKLRLLVDILKMWDLDLEIFKYSSNFMTRKDACSKVLDLELLSEQCYPTLYFIVWHINKASLGSTFFFWQILKDKTNSWFS